MRVHLCKPRDVGPLKSGVLVHTWGNPEVALRLKCLSIWLLQKGSPLLLSSKVTSVKVALTWVQK